MVSNDHEAEIIIPLFFCFVSFFMKLPRVSLRRNLKLSLFVTPQKGFTCSLVPDIHKPPDHTL